jgi:omega-amidase
MPALNVTIVQSDLHWHEPEKNLEHFSNLLRTDKRATDLVVLPEMFSTGFTMHASSHAESMDGRSVTWMRETALELGSAICGSLIIEDDGRYFNRFLLVRTDGTAEHYDKRHLFRLAGEHEHYALGTSTQTFELKGWRIRPMVCYDLRFPVWSRNRNDYDLLVYVANWPDRRHQAWETLLRARAIENLAYVAGVNRVGRDGNEIRYVGGSAVIDYLGNYRASAGEESGIFRASLDMEGLLEFREKFPFYRDADEFTL